jgi:tetratricopeptide (TPR) repeat protein
MYLLWTAAIAFWVVMFIYFAIRGRWVIMMYKATYLGEKGQYSKSHLLFDKVIERIPNTKQVWNNKASILIKEGKYSEAIECCQKAIKIDPNYAPSYYNKACAEISLGNISNALESLKKAVKFKPELYEAAKSDECFRSIWQDKRFIDIMRQAFL